MFETIPFRYAFFALLLTCCLSCWGRFSSGQEKLPKSWETDSSLRSVFFVDHDSGWAVGDRGTILRTEDGGRSWNSISSPRDVIWSKVLFINEKVGWIVGGHYRGSFDRSVGVMIRTIDGGKTWQNHSQNGMPFVKSIDFEDEQNGWVFCDSNSIHASGLLTTKDGGHTWRNAAGFPTKKLKLAQKLRHSTGYVGIDEMNRWIQIDRSVQVGSTVPFGDPIKLVETGRTLLSVADGKLFQRNLDGAWQQVINQLQPDGIQWTDAVSKGKLVRAVGNPGHLILCSDDGGREWRLSRTG